MAEQESSVLITCRYCGALMVKVSRDICPECYRKEEELFLRIKDFLRFHMGASISQIAENCNCSENEVFGFIKSGRLERIGLGRIPHECELCNTIIYEGVMCEECKKKLNSHVKNLAITSAMKTKK